MSKRNILYLYDSEQVPFGKLSPLYFHKLRIGQEESSNIISYSYAGLVRQGGVRNDLLKESGQESRISSLQKFREEKDDIYNEMLEEGLLNRVRQNKVCRDLLLQSSNGTILYESDNTYLGTNQSGGYNLVGNILMKIRKIIVKDELEKNKKRLKYILEKNIYTINTVYNTLEHKIKTGVDNLSRYIGKSAEEIMENLNLSPFPGSFDKPIDSKLQQYLSTNDGKNPTKKIAEDLRQIYAEEYNENALELQKKDILHTFLINRALKSLPSSGNYSELYKRYKQLKNSGIFNEEYQVLSKTFRSQINDIRDFIIKLSEIESLKNLEDRVYYLASKNLIDIPVDKIDTIPVNKISEKKYKEYIEKTKSLTEKIKKQGNLDKELLKEVEDWKNEELRLLKLERYYMRKAKEDVINRENLVLENKLGSEETTSIDDLWEFYQKNYPTIFYDILKAKQQIENEIYLEQLLEKQKKTALYWIKIGDEYKKEVFDELLKWAKSSSQKELEKTIESINTLEQGNSQKIFKVTDFIPLSPYYIDLIEIDNFIFPNVMYYIYYKLFHSISNPILKDKKDETNSSIWSHNMLMLSESGQSRNHLDYKLLQDIVLLYNQYENIYIQVILKNRSTKALYNKFKDTPNYKLNKLLIASNPRVLVYNNNEDYILGSGSINQGRYEGLNIIGNVMTQIREELSNKYGKVVVEDIDISPVKKIQIEKDFIMNDYIYGKMRELLYIFMLYSSLIKNNDTITLDSTRFVLEKLYNKTTEPLIKMTKNIKTPHINILFQKEVQSFLDNSNFKINKDALLRLWSHIFLLNELMTIEVVEKNLDLFKKRKKVINTPIEYGEIKDFVMNIEYEPKELFLKTVTDNFKELGSIEVSLSITYFDKSKLKSIKTFSKNIENLENLDKVYLELTLPLLNKIKDNIKYKDFLINIYSSNINLLRSEYVKKQKSDCINKNCVLQTYIDILTKLKENKDITTITGNTLSFIDILLSTSQRNDKVKYPNLLKITPSSNEDLSLNMSLLNIISSRTDMSVIDKYDGMLEFEPQNKITSGLFDNIKNSEKFACKLVAKLIRKDRILVDNYTIKYSGDIFDVSHQGDNIGIVFSLKDDKIYYKFPDDINIDMISLNIKYQVLSIVKSTNLSYMFNKLSKNNNDMARVVSFMNISYFLKDEEGYEEDREDEKEKYLIKNLKQNIKIREVEDDKEDKEDKEEDGEEEEEEEEGEPDEVSEEEEDDYKESEEEAFYED
jgi:predicted NAD-dependent protein-ADP-ribosyltransferase YbiA (DUF1768 family)